MIPLWPTAARIAGLTKPQAIGMARESKIAGAKYRDGRWVVDQNQLMDWLSDPATILPAASWPPEMETRGVINAD